ncbi:unnamed protein product [Bursaphelenchus okinawaensis]|uniref:Serine/threonine-protein phosphatase n=1 Tax=Bursaphelenchus okinawaensis TaxID=465554 RepID=A0A811KBN1_9BILA|nr:unnamed protein product [Bursaphelenchus okinawaensis]CAG9097025.1 unnamed protein product [Bursaphelenchus okinawaensis]
MDKMEKFSDSELDKLMCHLLCSGTPLTGLTKIVTEENLTKIALVVSEIFNEQGSLVELNGPVNICGDLHGQYGDLLRLFNKCGFPPETNYLFLGDYVDRGPSSIETVSLLFCYKIKYPESVFLLRGNHETRPVNQVYGFYEECLRRYSEELYNVYSDTFMFMPFCGLVGDKILCMHGGISPMLKNLDQLRNLKRPLEPVGPIMEMDVLWADPLAGINGFVPNRRGASYYFGEDALNEMLQILDLDMVVRAHQVVQDGFEFFANRKLVTIFSAPHYCGQFNNAAAVLKVTEDLSCSFVQLKPYVMEGDRDNKTIPTFAPERERKAYTPQLESTRMPVAPPEKAKPSPEKMKAAFEKPKFSTEKTKFSSDMSKGSNEFSSDSNDSKKEKSQGARSRSREKSGKSGKTFKDGIKKELSRAHTSDSTQTSEKTEKTYKKIRDRRKPTKK